MEFIENFFQKLWLLNENKQRDEKNTCKLEVHEKGLSAFADAVFGDSKNPILLPAKRFIGVSGPALYLPESINVFSEKDLNKKIYLNLILISAAADKLKLQQGELKSSPLQQRIQSLRYMTVINTYLDNEFVGYFPWQKQIYNELELRTKDKNNHLFKYWQNLYMKRQGDEFSFSPLSWEFKENEEVPAFMFFSVPCLEIKRLGAETLSLTKTPTKKEKNSIKTELKKKNRDLCENVNLEEEKANPVTHSFEKLETADEYQGGYRFDSGEDQLQEHSQALEELSLSKVTRGGEAAQSVYSAEGFYLSPYNDEKPLNVDKKNFTYPEWNVKKNQYQAKFCQLVETNFKEGFKIDSVSQSCTFLQRIKEHYRHEILPWKKKISSLVNHPLWENRLLEGDEIDCDTFIRERTDWQKQLPVSQKWYAKKTKSLQEFSITVLFDQSMSSDSWIKNVRVLDVILDSVGLLGVIFEDLITNIEVAGTWSETRHHCRYQIYKSEKAPWQDFYLHAGNVEPQGYTRLGPAIRHATTNLMTSSSSKKLLLLITDGKPTDLDGYEGRYGIEDVKKACSEAQAKGILPFALTIDDEVKQIFPKMFNHYIVLNKPEKLPQELYKIILALIGS